MDTLIVIGAKYTIIAVGLLAIIATLLSEKPTRWNIIKLALLSFPIAFLLALIAGCLYYDTRPFVVESIEPLIPHAADNGFPSNHTLYAMVAATTLYAHRRKLGIFLGILAILIGVSRIMADVHYPIDIIGAIIIAMAATGLAQVTITKVLTK